ncbi:MAG TPA: PAS domain-containing protein [Longimicrobium sp.]|nr:PAS domain-containing protein [Longimicrobium sp.]
MNELPVFISYRQSDGSELAFWVHDVITGLDVTIEKEGILISAIVSPYLDRSSPGIDDWQNLHKAELERALALVVICTPDASSERRSDETDWLYEELRWWILNRRKIAPILIAPEQHGQRYVPDILLKEWPRAQVIRVTPHAWDGTRVPTATETRSIHNSITAIRSGIASSAGDIRIGQSPEPWTGIGVLSSPAVFAWEKDRSFRYLNVNESYARAAGFDSPHAMIGKTDENMPWRALVSLFREGDARVMAGAGRPRICSREKEIMVDHVADIIVNESPLRDRFGKVVGLTGCFMDITGLTTTERGNELPPAEIPLGSAFGDERFTATEVRVFRSLVQGLSRGEIAVALNVRRGVVDAAIRCIMRKLQCSTEADIVVTAVRAGLPLALFGPVLGDHNG